MRPPKNIYLLLLMSVFLSCWDDQSSNNQSKVELISTRDNYGAAKNQEKIIKEYLENGAWKHQLYSREWQEEIDKGLSMDSTIAYLWQQKAMPMFKQGKHEVGLIYIDKAVKYDPRRWQDYRAFIKCIFIKNYTTAIEDFENYKENYGYGFVMDHSYNFYIGLSYLQLNRFVEAEQIFKIDFQIQLNKYGASWLHPVDLFYYGISRYEQKKYKSAIEMFDRALELYPKFSDAQYYKSECLRRTGKEKEADQLEKISHVNGSKGFTMNEDNVFYERYPYQVRWEK